MALNYTPAIGYSPVAKPVANVNYTPANQSVLGARTTAPVASYGTPTAAIGSSSGGGYIFPSQNDDLISKYRASGWNDENAIKADIAAGGGSKFDASSNEALMGAIEDAYNSQMGYAGQAEQNVRGQYPGVQSDIQGNYNQGIQALGGQKNIAEGQLAGAETAAGQRKIDVVNAARRLFQELSMGGQQRFGGASSAGQAYGELTNREFQRSQAGAEQGLTNTLQQVQQQRADLQTKHEAAIGQLETQKAQALTAAKADFENKLLQIDQMRASAGENKGNLKLQALQDLRNQTFEIQMQAEQIKAQLGQQVNSVLDQSTQEFGSIGNAGQGAYTNYAQGTTTAPLSSLTMGPSILSGQAPQQYTGIRTRQDEFGNIL